MRISDWSSDVCSSDLQLGSGRYAGGLIGVSQRALELGDLKSQLGTVDNYVKGVQTAQNRVALYATTIEKIIDIATDAQDMMIKNRDPFFAQTAAPRVQVETLLDQVGSLMQVKDGARYLFGRSEEHTSELQSLMRISYAVFCL